MKKSRAWIEGVVSSLACVVGLLCLAVDVPSGTVPLETNAEVPNPVPACLSDKAAFWMDMSEASVVSEDGGETISMWRDCRETAAKDATPTFYYATPAWTNGGDGATVSYEYKGVNPSIRTVGVAERKTLYFHGRSGIFLRLKKNGVDARLLDNVRHIFAVHNPSNWFGAVVGGATENRKGAFLFYNDQNSYVYKMDLASTTPLFWNRVDLGDLGMLATSIRFCVDGESVDPFSYRPHIGWQLLDASFMDSVKGGTAEAIFYQRWENFPDSQPENYLKYTRAGGDYLAELAVFTNQLSATEIAAVRAYLSAKWKLPDWMDAGSHGDNPLNRLVAMSPVESVNVGAAATATADVSAGEASRPFCLAGDGVVAKTGDGDLVIGASQGLVPFTGSLVLGGGSILLRNGLPPAFVATPGRTLSSVDYVPGDNTPANQAKGGVKITVSENAAVDTFVKAGGCAAVVGDVDASVMKVAVEGGELTLGAALNGGYRGEVVVENGDFEANYHCPSGDNNYSRWAYNLCDVPADGLNGWRATPNSSAFFQRVGRGCTFADGSLVENAQTSDGKKWLGTSPWNLYTSVGGGCQIVNLQGGTVYTKVRLPTDGCYEISFDMSERNSSVKHVANAAPVVVLFGETTANWRRIATCQTTARFWTNVREVTPKVTAGEYLIGFQREDTGGDCSVYLDNVKMRFHSTSARDTYAIPNGDFEQMDLRCHGTTPDCWSVNYFSTLNVPVGWTFDSPAWSGGASTEFNPVVGIVNPNIRPRWSSSTTDGNTPICGTRQGVDVQGEDTHGSTALLFVGNLGSASTTFTPPAGTWRLRHRLNRTYVCANSGKLQKYSEVAPAISARVMVGGVETDLGTVSKPVGDSRPFDRFDHPNAFTTDGATPVTLTISNTVANVGVMVDDLELVPEHSIADREGELVKNGGFESSTSDWQTYTPQWPTNQIVRTYNGTAWRVYLDGTTYAYGAMRYEGYRCYLFKNFCGLRQDIDFPAAGLYRLRFGFRSRVDDAGYADGDFAIKIWQGTVTNQLAFINYQYQRNFAEREYLFHIPERGKYTLGFENYGPHNGRGAMNAESTCFIDGVSVCRVDWDVPETLSINADAKISVAPNATLNLAFTGTNVVRSVAYDGCSAGLMTDKGRVVNAATCPMFISGSGTLLVKSNGLMLIFR